MKIEELSNEQLLTEIKKRLHKVKKAKFPEEETEEEADEEVKGNNEFNAVCSDCGNNCSVPFKPKEDWPVRCRECYAKTRQQ